MNFTCYCGAENTQASKAPSFLLLSFLPPFLTLSFSFRGIKSKVTKEFQFPRVPKHRALALFRCGWKDRSFCFLSNGRKTEQSTRRVWQQRATAGTLSYRGVRSQLLAAVCADKCWIGGDRWSPEGNFGIWPASRRWAVKVFLSAVH